MHAVGVGLTRVSLEDAAAAAIALGWTRHPRTEAVMSDPVSEDQCAL